MCWGLSGGAQLGCQHRHLICCLVGMSAAQYCSVVGLVGASSQFEFGGHFQCIDEMGNNVSETEGSEARNVHDLAMGIGRDEPLIVIVKGFLQSPHPYESIQWGRVARDNSVSSASKGASSSLLGNNRRVRMVRLPTRW